MHFIALLTAMSFCICVAGCATTLPIQSSVKSGYTLERVKVVSISTTCPSPKLDNVEPSFTTEYCPMLGSTVRLAIKSKFPSWQIRETDTDAQIEVILEELYGGSAQARFWVGFGAGKTATTVYVRVKQNGTVIAEGRLIETSTMPNVNTGNWSNESLLTQDAPLISRKVASFIANPEEFK